MRRAADLLIAVAALVVLSPLLVLIAAWVRVDSRGPALFRQTRVGRHGEPFEIHKFRTMRSGPPGAAITVGEDPRITRAGRVLRRSKLDELPQLLDVVTGHMSLVGPRPELPAYVALWPADTRDVVLSVRPGITDPASVRFAHEAELLASQPDPHAYYTDVVMPEKLRMYEEYVRTRSAIGDLRILAATIGRLTRHEASTPDDDGQARPIRYFAFANAKLPATDYRVAYATHTTICDVRLVLPERPAVLPEDRFVRLGVTEGFAPRSLVELCRIPWILTRGRADLAHFFATQFVLAGPLLARLVGVRSLVTVTGTGRAFSGTGLRGRVLVAVYRFFFRLTSTLSEAVLFQSEADLEFLREAAGPRNAHKLQVIGSAVDPTPFDGVREPDIAPPGVVMIGRIQESKGVDDFLEVAQALSGLGEFTLVGPPARGEEQLLARVQRADSDGTARYLGGVSDAEVRDLYRSTNLVVITSQSEGVPRVALEAALARRAVVAYDIPGCVAALPAECLVPAGDRDALRRRVEELLAAPHDRMKVAATAHDWVVERFGVDGFTRRMDDLISRVTGAPEPLPARATERTGL